MKKHLVLKLSQTKCGRLQKPNKKSIFVSLTKDTLSCYKAAYNLFFHLVEELLRPGGSGTQRAKGALEKSTVSFHTHAHTCYPK